MQTVQPKHFIATSKNGREVYVHLTHSVVASSISRQPRLVTLLAELLPTIDLSESMIAIEHDMGRQIGYGEIVETSPNDTVFYAMQLRSKVYTRFVKHKVTEPTQNITIRAQRDSEDNYEIVAAHIGASAPAFPDEPAATPESALYWQNHAMVYNGQPIIGGTVTKDWPY